MSPADRRLYVPRRTERFVPLTLVHRGDGREVMIRPLGPVKVSSALALPLITQSLECTSEW
jgi:hypothetical protein